MLAYQRTQRGICKGKKEKYRKHWSSEEGASAYISAYDALCLALKVFCWKRNRNPEAKHELNWLLKNICYTSDIPEI